LEVKSREVVGLGVAMRVIKYDPVCPTILPRIQNTELRYCNTQNRCIWYLCIGIYQSLVWLVRVRRHPCSLCLACHEQTADAYSRSRNLRWRLRSLIDSWLHERDLFQADECLRFRHFAPHATGRRVSISRTLTLHNNERS